MEFARYFEQTWVMNTLYPIQMCFVYRKQHSTGCFDNIIILRAASKYIYIQLIECNFTFYHLITLLQNEAINVNNIISMLLYDTNKLKNMVFIYIYKYIFSLFGSYLYIKYVDIY